MTEIKRAVVEVVCFSTADWDATLWTNKQHLMSRLADRGVGVLYVDSLGLRTPGLGKQDIGRVGHRLWVWRPFARQVRPLIWRDSPLVIPSHGIPAIRWVNTVLLRARLARNGRRLKLEPSPVVWAYNPNAATIVPGSWPIVYHCVDDLASFPGVDTAAFHRAERLVARRATVCLASSRVLLRRLQEMGARDVRYWPNPADVESYVAAAPATPHVGRPRVGFIGALQTHKVDLELIVQVARLLPDFDFSLVGPVGHGMRDREVAAQLEQLPANAKVVRAVGREQLPDLLATFAVGIIPYKVNHYTSGVFPMKLFEYLASGMPVVSTPLPSLIGEVEEVAFADSPAAFAKAIQTAAGTGRASGEPAAAARQRYALGHSWNARADEALALLREVRS
jgi:glycosyltransferase involved in cell wall biosynthesis